jgi:glycosyltransferase involved in cell wall biosynthesis
VDVLIADPGLAKRLGEAGREWVLRERTWSANGGRYLDIYAEVLERWRIRRIA